MLMTRSLFQTYQGVKVLVIGSHRSGKSSLIHSLVDQQPRLADDMTDMAVGIDAYEMSFDYDVEEGKPGIDVIVTWGVGHPPPVTQSPSHPVTRTA